ncbi:MAG: serine/threonine-protein kinase [Elainellaceae cyanobacterium]
MELYCTRPTCPRPTNRFSDLDDSAIVKTVPQKYCTACGMPQILAGRYIPLKLLGRGGFGAAFLARDRYTPTMRLCVVKQFQPAGTLTPDQLQLAQRLFEREAEVLESLGNRHPQIPDLLAFFELDVPSRTPGESEKFFYLVQEFVNGHNMEEILEDKGFFSEAEVTEVLVEILKVLKFVHHNGSIHRDIKPSNIMRHQDGRYYLLDFGAVKQVTTTASMAGQPLRRSTGIYSKGYAPPEQTTGGSITPATDLYALAVTCIVLLTGKQPSDLLDPRTNDWNWQSQVRVSDRLASVLNRMLLSAPSHRFQSADEALTALQTATSPLSPSAAVPPPAVRSSAGGAAPVQHPPPVSPAVSAPAPGLSPRPSRSLVEVLGNAAFTGFEGSLVAIGLASLLGTVISPIFWLILLGITGSLIVAQHQRWIEKIDLVIIAAITLALLVFISPLNTAITTQIATIAGGKVPFILLVAGFVGLLAIAITIVFRLIYNLLSRFL